MKCDCGRWLLGPVAEQTGKCVRCRGEKVDLTPGERHEMLYEQWKESYQNNVPSHD